MPFQSKAQIRACFANQKRNPDTTWNCREWLHETGSTKNLPETKSSPKKSVKSPKKTVISPRNVKSPKRKILTGPKGGKYYMNGNKKVYIK
jgi:hypothetical protein